MPVGDADGARLVTNPMAPTRNVPAKASLANGRPAELIAVQFMGTSNFPYTRVERFFFLVNRAVGVRSVVAVVTEAATPVRRAAPSRVPTPTPPHTGGYR